MNKKTILLDLTPLLDVILVMLFLVLMQSEVRVDTMYTEARDLVEEELAALQQEFGDEMQVLRQDSLELDALRLGLEEDTGVIIISLLSNDVDDSRRIVIEANTETEITLNWDGMVRDAAARELNEVLANSVQDSAHAFSFIIFRYDSMLVYDDDRMLVRLAIHNHQLANPQVFSAELDLR